ncbi:hypothetical protein M9458_021687, partial [Cirrhinus mrigala]
PFLLHGSSLPPPGVIIMAVVCVPPGAAFSMSRSSSPPWTPPSRVFVLLPSLLPRYHPSLPMLFLYEDVPSGLDY